MHLKVTVCFSLDIYSAASECLSQASDFQLALIVVQREEFIASHQPHIEQFDWSQHEHREQQFTYTAANWMGNS